MNAESLTMANKGLVDRVNVLSVQVAKQEKMLKLFFEFVTHFGHFVPNTVSALQIALDEIETEDSNIHI